MTIADNLERLARAERAYTRFQGWRFQLVRAMSIMKEKGNESSDRSHYLPERWWKELYNMLSVVSDDMAKYG